MNKFLFALVSVLIFNNLQAQVLDPVKWKYAVKRISDTEADLQMTATIDEGWHVYSKDLPPEATGLPTEVTFKESKDYELIGGLKEPKPIEENSVNFGEISYHAEKVTFSQRVKILSEKPFKITGELSFMVCDDSKCLPPEWLDLSFDLKGAPKKPDPKSQIKEETNSQKTPEDQSMDAGDIAPGVDEESEEIDYAAADNQDSIQSDTTENQDVATITPTEPKKESRSLITIFILSFLGGFAALLTPCVFPMIPLTVSFFTKTSKTRAKGVTNAILYGASIVILYTLLGWLITVIFGSDSLNAFSTNPWVNIAFFLLLVVFAISFFGAFEITLPSSWVNKTTAGEDKGGILGIFFMALTLALVSFSCTGPIIGTLLVEAAAGSARGPLVGMFGFSLALALPFTLFAAFPGWLNSLPKSGGWLNSVKVFLGFIELAFAFKFLSNADLVWQAGFLKREWFIAIWIAIFALTTLYLLGGFRMPHDSKLEKVSVFRLLMAIASLFFVVYLVPGLWGAPLKLISGFPPPMHYAESPGGFGTPVVASSSVAKEIPDGADPDHCPHRLNCFHDFETGLEYAKEVGKPILLDFTGHACVNCRKMEEQVWSDPRVLEILQDDIVLISLYVDERTKLPDNEQYVSDITGKKIKTIGNKWSEFQVEHYQSNSQPQYVMINHESKVPLIETTAYDPDIPKFIDWLERGVSAFEE